MRIGVMQTPPTWIWLSWTATGTRSWRASLTSTTEKLSTRRTCLSGSASSGGASTTTLLPMLLTRRTPHSAMTRSSRRRLRALELWTNPRLHPLTFHYSGGFRSWVSPPKRFVPEYVCCSGRNPLWEKGIMRFYVSHCWSMTSADLSVIAAGLAWQFSGTAPL